MGLFNRNKKDILKDDRLELPELPEPTRASLLPRSKIPDVPLGLPKIETYSLPIFPNSEAGERFNQEAIKDAIGRYEPELEHRKPIPLIRSIAPIPTRDIEEKRTLELSEINQQKIPKQTKRTEPIFIRLDKFQATNEAFEEMKNKISEIEELLRKTHDVKVKEEQELAEWEREIQIIKSRIDLIDRDIFSKLDEFL